MKPVRVQRKRTKGWKMPKNTVYVGRPGFWGNPYQQKDLGLSRKECVAYFKKVMKARLKHPESEWSSEIKKLKGKNLACWCKPEDPCHADILLELANPIRG